MNSYYSLEETIVDTELRHINFFNGRLLTSGDFEAEQSAQHTHSRHLGMGVGAGVAFGLEVTPATDSPPGEPLLVVTKGLAVNRVGQTLRLQCDQRVALIPSADPTAGDECIFNDCDPKAAGVTLASGTGFYVLLIAPASKSEGKAPVSGLGNNLALCNSRYLTEGVKFRLLRLNVSAGTDANKVRNVVAYQCFGLANTPSNDIVQSALNGMQSPLVGLEALVPTGYLTDNDVPLAIIEWNTTGLGFVDQWSVRRCLARCGADTLWEPLIGDRRLAEGEAMFLQFQDQVSDMLDSNLLLSQVVANQQFAYLPPVGFLPVDTGPKANGVHYETFFGQMTYREPIFVEGAQLRSVIREAINYPPIDTNGKVVIWLYVVRENAQAALGSANPPQSYMVFVTGHTWYRGEAHYDIHHWNFGNYT